MKPTKLRSPTTLPPAEDRLRRRLTIAYFGAVLALLLFAGLAAPALATRPGLGDGPSLADKKTARVWTAKCASCHGEDGKGETDQGRKMGVLDLTTPARQKELTDDRIREVLETGIDRTKDGKKQEMKSYAEELTPDQVEALVVFIRDLAAK
jgi:mono/diheme cytochrome c family protein